MSGLHVAVRPRERSTVPELPAADRPEALLTMAGYHGTLAAVRSLGRHGIRVMLADGDRLGAARWSRHVTRAVGCPPVNRAPTRFIDWLLSTGAREPGRVLCTTSDSIAWLFARHREVLATYFRLYLPGADAMYTLLNKWRLHEVCVNLGIDVPPTWLPTSADDLARVQHEARFPVVVKPQTQVLLHPHQKGRIVHEPGALRALYQDFVSATAYSPLLLEWDPTVAGPIVQNVAETSRDGIYSLSGFIDESGELVAVRASRKVLQWPPRLGVGLCFEDVVVRQSQADDVARLCRHIGYFGPFEVEFIRSDERYQLIDFNPRFFGQMAFDVSRGLDVPYMVYLGALGEQRELERRVQDARQPPDATVAAHCHRIDLLMALRLQRWAGRISRDDCERWRDWLRRGRVTDAVVDRDDWAPAVAEATAAVIRRAIHPRNTWRSAHEV